MPGPVDDHMFDDIDQDDLFDLGWLDLINEDEDDMFKEDED